MIADNWGNADLYMKKDLARLMLDFVKAQTMKSEETRYPLKGDDIYAMISSYETRSFDKAVLESHKRYVDVQTLISGCERIEYYPVSILSVKTPYDDVKDAAFYHIPEEKFGRNILIPDLFHVYFPQDGHAPCLVCAERPSKVKKIVFKIRKELFLKA